MSLPCRPQAVVFDLDGTLIDSEALVREAYLAVSARFGPAMTDAQFLSLVGLNRDANDAQLRAIYGAAFPLEEFYTAARAHIGGRPAPLKPGVRALLDALDAAGARYGLATSSGHEWTRAHLDAHGLTGRFAALIARGDYARAKPDPEPYLKAAAALEASPAACLAIEDSYNGVRAAHGAGMMTIMVPDLLEPTDEMRALALGVYQSLEDVRALLAELD